MEADLHYQAILGCLLGTAVGDSLGLPSEGLSAQRIAARWRGGLRHRFFFGRGMCSDDTEQTLMLARALLRHSDDVAAFQRSFAWKLRWWLLAFPAGVGMGTAKAVMRLWLGFPAARAGVQSAGNGAAMRSAIIGVVFVADEATRREFALAACRVTHRDPRAEESVLLVTEAAALATKQATTPDVLHALSRLITSAEMKARFSKLAPALDAGRTVRDYAVEIGCERGVSGFAPNTVAVALYAWLRHRGDFARAVEAVISCGGDTDTVAAITGALAGIEGGEASIPREWVAGIMEWPRTVEYMRQLPVIVAGMPPPTSTLQPFFALGIVARNLFFLLVVILHGFRRLLPPY